jgi:hypothetical protein
LQVKIARKLAPREQEKWMIAFAADAGTLSRPARASEAGGAPFAQPM